MSRRISTINTCSYTPKTGKEGKERILEQFNNDFLSSIPYNLIRILQNLHHKRCKTAKRKIMLCPMHITQPSHTLFSNSPRLIPEANFLDRLLDIGRSGFPEFHKRVHC